MKKDPSDVNAVSRSTTQKGTKQVICSVCGRKFPENLSETLCYQCKEAANAGEDLDERKKRYDDVRQQYLSHAEQFGLEDEPARSERKPFWKFWG